MLALKVPPPIIFAASGFCMFALSDFQMQLTPWRLTICLVIWLLAMAIALTSIWCFFKCKTSVDPHHPDKSSVLIATGIFNFSRNPMYLSLLLILIGWAFLLSSFWTFVPIIAFILYITQFQIKPEEEILAKKFNDDYHRYCSSVRRWF
ncbi:methyltransferase family protein [Marinomonas algarum]|uniref:Isoprenylcysteine carboxylmethyltransferase family protein n=1 Tax=Marinomonas algarum TaxID=2883105 RepID=A0A9X1IR97_9GAMM|nr:isoprenylcysteine carboxylmethyltransferase family protein [Marinomonas algarum]MCB5162841.1 isoprenylcysteine carboxylmethyltransferase family protein [Marinomonas algarum]